MDVLEAANEVANEAAQEPLESLLRLHLAGRLGVRGLQALRAGFGSLAAAFEAGERAVCERSALSPRAAKRLGRVSAARVRRELERAHGLGVRVVGFGHEGYPPALAAIDDPPLVLYVKGTLQNGERRAAIVGARRASGYGLRMAERLAHGLAEAQVCVVSGLALGVDAAAHRGALEAGGRTIAVLACGLGTVYPRRHERLAARIERSGALVSELPLEAPPRPFQFPRRNRLISGVSEAVCVVEAAARSGSLTTARWALEQGREVLAVPGRVEDRCAAGTLALLADGAAPALGAESVLDAMGIVASGALRCEGGVAGDQLQSVFGAVQRKVLDALETDALSADDVIERSGLDAQTVLATLFELELAGWLCRAGARWQRVR